MRIYALNASPRKGWNDDLLLDAFIEGAQDANGEIEIEKIHIYDLDYKGCRSCYGCKLLTNETAECVVRDGIHDLLKAIRSSDGLVYAAPIYYGTVPGQFRALLERLMYTGPTSKTVPFAAIYTNNNPNAAMFDERVMPNLDQVHGPLKMTLGEGVSEVVAIHDTLPRDHNERYRPSRANYEAKLEHREKFWPGELEQAREAGRRFAAHVAEVASKQ